MTRRRRNRVSRAGEIRAEHGREERRVRQAHRRRIRAAAVERRPIGAAGGIRADEGIAEAEAAGRGRMGSSLEGWDLRFEMWTFLLTRSGGADAEAGATCLAQSEVYCENLEADGLHRDDDSGAFVQPTAERSTGRRADAGHSQVVGRCARAIRALHI